MSDYKYVHPRVNKAFEKSMALMIFHHITGTNAQRYYDSFRGMLNFAYELNYVTVDGLLFLSNFVCWLEYKQCITDEREALAYQYVYDDFVPMLNDIIWGSNEK